MNHLQRKARGRGAARCGAFVGRSNTARRRGAALVEFALISVIFLTMLLGMLQFGVYLSVTNALWNLSREGARYAAVQPAGEPGGAQSADDKIKAHISRVLPSNINAADLRIEIFPAISANRTGGTPVEVKLTYNMEKKLFIPMPSALFERGLATSYVTSTKMMVESN